MTTFTTIISCMIIFSTYVFITPTTWSSNETDLLALLDFKARIDHDPLGSLASWNQETHFCTWNGIRCGNLHSDRVVAIELLSQGLEGSLSPHIGNLSFLKTLTLQNNTFHGQIPQEISYLRRLEVIDLSYNTFIGAIPRNLSQCPNLNVLNLIVNRLSGVIPPEIGSLHELKWLYLSKNNFIRTIPPSLGNLTSLERLSINECGVEGEIPQSLINLKNLTFFNLGLNSLTGNVPHGLFNISNMELFAIHANQLEGEIPSETGLTLPNLKELYLGSNRFTGTIPPSLANASNLEVLVLLMNNFTGPMPKAGRLSNLRIFTTVLNPIQDDISVITSFINCTNLTLLNVGDNNLTGLLPSSVGNLSSKLVNLAIGNSQIYGNIPSSIVNLVGLTDLQIGGTLLDGSIPTDIGKLSNLGLLNFEENRLTNELPSSFRNLTSLIELSLSNNNFSGTIQTLSNFSNLIEVDLSYNNFNGQIPPEFLNIESISVSLDLSHNAFAGTIPSEVGSLSNLMNLDFANNRLTGLVPNTISKCTRLQRFHLEGNSLGGEIPPGLRELIELQDLDLSRNNFSGPIPRFLSTLNLEKLNLSNNRLQGEVPMQGIFANTTAIFLEGNNELCGGSIELDFPPCSFSTKKRSLSLLKKILIPCACLLFLVSVGLTTMFIYRRKTKIKHLSSLPTFNDPFIRLSYADLVKATDGFSRTNLIGNGRSGTVYKGTLEDQQILIAVKVLNLSVRGAFKSFTAECNALRGLRHRNLVKILSVCESIDFQGNDFKALVYDFKVNGSLEEWLHNEVGRGSEENDAEPRKLKLTMFQRLEIAIGVAHALEHLHCGMQSSVVHGDLKPSNILLDHDLNAFVGDFGLAKIVSSVHESSSSVMIKGTIGYIAPEYATSYTVSTQGDVYSYGILLLEMFTNTRPTDEAFEDHFNLHNFVVNALQDNVMEIVDPLIRVEHETDGKIENCMVSMLSLGVKCSRSVPRDRILMTDVSKELHKIRDYYKGQGSN